MEFENCTLVELRQLAKERGVKNTSKMKKEELIQELSNLEELSGQAENKTVVENFEEPNNALATELLKILAMILKVDTK